MPIPIEDITGVVLAGGQGRRMGGQDKGLVELHGKPLITQIVEVLAPQVGQILISANRNLGRYRALGHPVVSDELAGFQGPLAGFAAAMTAVTTNYLITLPCDGPKVPDAYVTTMVQALESQDCELAVAHDGERLQPVYALLPVVMGPSLTSFLAGGDRKIDLWYARHRMANADFSRCTHAFRNINTPGDRDNLQLERARS